MPTASATDMVACTIEDQYGQPLSGADVTVTNHATQDSTVISSDSNGDCTINAGDINLQTGQIVGLVWIGTLTLSGCGVNYPASMSMPYDPARGITMVGFSNPQPPPTIPSTLTTGTVTSERNAQGTVTVKSGLRWARIQGDGSPWGNFDVHVDFRLKDDQDLPGAPNVRSHDFEITVNYLGYYDANCAWNAVAGGSDNANFGLATYADANVPYDSGTDQVQLDDLDAAQVNQGNNDKLMKIEVVAEMNHCNPGVGGCPGALDFTSKNTYYVEP